MISLPTVSSFSIVIPAHNAADTIAEQLDAVRESDCGELDCVVVVDSCSTDGTGNLVSRYSKAWPKVRLVVASRPGANVARNTGVDSVRSDAVLLCDADDVVGEDWAAALLGALQSHELVRGRYSLKRLNQADAIAARGSLASTSPPGVGEKFGGLGGNCGFRRDAWQRLDGLREHHYGSDDAEFFWRAHEEGMRVGYVDGAVVHYRLRPGYRSLYRQQRSWSSGRALLLSEFGGKGFVSGRPFSSSLKAWAWLIVHVADAFSADPQRRGRWVRSVADADGRIRGSVKHRVWFV